MISFTTKGDFRKTEKFLAEMSKRDFSALVKKHAETGVSALAAATPVESGLTAASWSYEIFGSRGSFRITWKNGHVVNGVPIAIILQYGHGTGTGGYVAGRDYINPAIKPVFDKIAEEIWKAVKSA